MINSIFSGMLDWMLDRSCRIVTAIVIVSGGVGVGGGIVIGRAIWGDR